MNALSLAASVQPVPASEPARELAIVIHLLADASPGLLSRVLEPLAKRDLVPDKVLARRDGDAMRIELRLDAVEEDAAHRVLGNLAQIIGMRSVRHELVVTRRMAA
ncbi:MAG TPA: hypothetical protein VD970_09540 [Acetobacteraceae bacterium]|nr:hypothetical protein [Acetobacteraceae bacterium]